MDCSYPVVFNGQLCPCQRCMACRINKKRLWIHRMMLESYCHAENLFLTLTYNDENLPKDGSVSPRELQLYIKRLRELVKPTKFRFFAVGEYGDESFRPHYHLILFGLGASHIDAIDRAWQKGFVGYGTFSSASASYTAGYCTKKMTSDKDSRLGGRYPEFVRMSNRPGIGVPALDTIIQSLQKADINLSGDVPKVLRHGDKYYPLGRLLKEKLRNALFTQEKIDALKFLQKEEMRDLRKSALSSAEFLQMTEYGKDYLFELRNAKPQQELSIRKKMSFWKKRKL